jgi:hypothetical protein
MSSFLLNIARRGKSIIGSLTRLPNRRLFAATQSLKPSEALQQAILSTQLSPSTKRNSIESEKIKDLGDEL